MTTETDVTDLVDFDPGMIDSEALPIIQCACGQEFGSWDFVLSIYKDTPNECPNCHRKFYFRPSIRVYEVRDE